MVEKTALLRPASSPCGGGEYEEYHPYGTTAWWAEKSGIDVSRKRYRYTGQEKDEETGLCYHHHRYYLPWLGRWASADPAGLVDGPNRHWYGCGAPTGRVDRSGLNSAGKADSANASIQSPSGPSVAAGPQPVGLGDDGVQPGTAATPPDWYDVWRAEDTRPASAPALGIRRPEEYDTANPPTLGSERDRQGLPGAFSMWGQRIHALTHFSIVGNSLRSGKLQLHQLPERLLAHYQFGRGAPFRLSRADVAALDPLISPQHPLNDDMPGSQRFREAVAELQSAGGGSISAFRFSAEGTVNYNQANNTLGHVWGDFEGTLTVSIGEDTPTEVRFEGTMILRDAYDFDPRPGGRRSPWGEAKTVALDVFVPGTPFVVTHDPIPVVYRETQPYIVEQQ